MKRRKICQYVLPAAVVVDAPGRVEGPTSLVVVTSMTIRNMVLLGQVV